MLKKVDDTPDLAKRSTYIEWQVSKAFQLDKMRDDLYELCDNLLDEILVLDNLPQEAKSLSTIQKMINEARQKVKKNKNVAD